MSARRLALLALLAASVPAVSRAQDERLAARCPAYPAQLRVARAALARGDRSAAAGALRRAQEALASCIREEAAARSLLAAHLLPTHQS